MLNDDKTEFLLLGIKQQLAKVDIDSINKFLCGRLRPEVQPLTLLYTIFHEKGTLFVYLLLTNGDPFTYLV